MGCGIFPDQLLVTDANVPELIQTHLRFVKFVVHRLHPVAGKTVFCIQGIKTGLKFTVILRRCPVFNQAAALTQGNGLLQFRILCINKDHLLAEVVGLILVVLHNVVVVDQLEIINGHGDAVEGELCYMFGNFCSFLKGYHDNHSTPGMLADSGDCTVRRFEMLHNIGQINNIPVFGKLENILHLVGKVRILLLCLGNGRCRKIRTGNLLGPDGIENLGSLAFGTAQVQNTQIILANIPDQPLGRILNKQFSEVLCLLRTAEDAPVLGLETLIPVLFGINCIHNYAPSISMETSGRNTPNWLPSW